MAGKSTALALAFLLLGTSAASAQGYGSTGAGSSAPDGGPALRSASPEGPSRQALDAAEQQTGKARTKQARAVPASPADVVAGKPVRDSNGNPVGTVESVDGAGAIVATGTGRVVVPLQAFGKNSDGLLLGVTKAEFDALVAGAAGQPAG